MTRRARQRVGHSLLVSFVVASILGLGVMAGGVDLRRAAAVSSGCNTINTFQEPLDNEFYLDTLIFTAGDRLVATASGFLGSQPEEVRISVRRSQNETGYYVAADIPNTVTALLTASGTYYRVGFWVWPTTLAVFDVSCIPAPVLVAGNDVDTTPMNTVLSITQSAVLSNDNWVAGDTFSVVAYPTHGMLSWGSAFPWRYTPNPDYCGSDSFSYVFRRNVGVLIESNRATVTIRVTCPLAAAINPARGTVNTNVTFIVTGFPFSAPVAITWRRTSGTVISIATVNTNSAGMVSGTIKVPATTGGPNQQITFKSGIVSRTVTFEVVPRIKSNTNPVVRGQYADISLRGYGKNETVKIRWKKGTSFVTLATIITSNTGSANVTIRVPLWAPDGPNVVRGDGSVFRAQTSQVNVQGGPFNPATAPSPSPTATTTNTPGVTSTATSTSTFVPTEAPTIEVTPTSQAATSTPEPSATETATQEGPTTVPSTVVPTFDVSVTPTTPSKDVTAQSDSS